MSIIEVLVDRGPLNISHIIIDLSFKSCLFQFQGHFMGTLPGSAVLIFLVLSGTLKCEVITVKVNLC